MIAITRFEDDIWVFNTETNQRAVFSIKENRKVSGDLDMTPEEAFYRAFKQTQNDLPEETLKKLWQKQNCRIPLMAEFKKKKR